MEPAPLFGGKGKHALPFYPMPLMEAYLDDLRTKGYSRSHLAQNRLALVYFGLFAQTENLRHPEEIERTHLLHFQAWLHKDAKAYNGDKLALGYQQSLMHNLRLWFKWLEANHHITENPWVRIKVGSQRRRSHHLEDHEVVAVFDAHRRQAFQTSPFYFHRREALLAVLFVWGLTLAELRALNLPNMDMRQDSIVIRFKGTKTRTLPYGPEMKAVIGRYLTQRAKHAQPIEDALFIDSMGVRMTDNNVYKVLQALGESAGVQLSAQRLRDTYGRRLMRSGTTARTASEMLGLSTTTKVAPYDPRKDEKETATQPLEDEVANLLGHDAPKPEYRRLE